MKRLLILVPLLIVAAGCGERQTAAEVVEEMVRTYQQAKSFTGESTEKIELRRPGQPQQAEMQHRVAYEAPNRFFTDIRMGGLTILALSSNGTELRVLDGQQEVVQEAAAPAKLAGSLDCLERFGAGTKNHPLAYIAGYNPLEDVEASYADGEKLDGPPTHVVELKGERAPTTTLWIGKEDHLLYQVSQLIPPELSQGGFTVQTRDRGRDLKLNGPVTPDLFAFTVPAGARSVPVAYVGAAAPTATLKDLDGRKYDLSALKGKVVLLNFWAFWCGPCRQELPTLQKLSAELASKGVVFLGVTHPDSRDPDWAQTRGALKEAGVTYPSLIDPTGVLSTAYGADGLPHSAIIDRSGVVVANLAGLRPESELREMLTKAGG